MIGEILIFDFGGKDNETLGAQFARADMPWRVIPGDTPAGAVAAMSPRGVVLAGGPGHVYEADAPRCDPDIFALGMPVLGVCYGMQLMCQTLGGIVEKREPENGPTDTYLDTTSPLFAGLQSVEVMRMGHTDFVAALPDGFVNIAHTDACPIAACQHVARNLYATQFHPEWDSSVNGRVVFDNFLHIITLCMAI